MLLADDWFPTTALGAAVTAALTILTFLWREVWKIAQRLAIAETTAARVAVLETKLETLTLFQLRRAYVEGVRSETLVPSGDGRGRPTREAMSWFAPMAEQLRELYRALPAGMSDVDLSHEIEARFGP